MEKRTTALQVVVVGVAHARRCLDLHSHDAQSLEPIGPSHAVLYVLCRWVCGPLLSQATLSGTGSSAWSKRRPPTSVSAASLSATARTRRKMPTKFPTPTPTRRLTERSRCAAAVHTARMAHHRTWQRTACDTAQCSRCAHPQPVRWKRCSRSVASGPLLPFGPLSATRFEQQPGRFAGSCRTEGARERLLQRASPLNCRRRDRARNCC
jgi:hypothetical protein